MKLLPLLALGSMFVACDPPQDANAPQNPTPNPQYPQTQGSAPAATTAPPTASATVATTAPPPVATTAPVATTQPTVAQPTPTVAATTTPPPTPTLPTLPAFPTFQLPNLPQINPAQLAQVLPAIPLDPNLLNQIKQAGQQLMNQGLLALGDPAETGLKAASVRYAPLMLAEGAPYKDSIPAGGHKAFDVTLAGNKCYTIIAYSPPNNVSNVDLHLLVPPFFNMDAGHDDSNDGTAVIGKTPAPICPFTLIPIPYRVDVYAKAGQGQVVVQVYSKNK